MARRSRGEVQSNPDRIGLVIIFTRAVHAQTDALVDYKMGLRWWRYVVILSQPKRYLDDRQARKYWLVSFGKTR